MSSKQSEYWSYGLPKYIDGVFERRKFNEGDLVTTITGDYGIVIGSGASEDLKKSLGRDNDNYYKVLIEDQIYHYLSYTLIKVKKNT